MRRTFTLLHRWIGLLSALFLFIAGFTGAIISWDHELDAALNPAFYYTAGPRPALEPQRALELASRLERAEPRLQVSWLPLRVGPDHALLVSVRPRLDPATGKLHELGFNQMALDPESGKVQAQRTWGEVSLARENLLPFLYKLHYTMHIPDGFGIELGMWLMGLIAIAWVLDCFFALWISFPNRKQWRRSIQFRFRSGGHRLNFDLHRSGGVWAWGLLLVLAVTAVSMNLNRQVMRPIVSVFSRLSARPFDEPPLPTPREPKVSREYVLERARRDAAEHGFREPAGGIFYNPNYDLYGVGFYEVGNEHGDGSLGNAYLYYRGADGSLLSAYEPGTGSAGDVFLQAQFPLHSGRWFGIPGRIAVSLLGAVVAMLSVTGVVIWARRRRARALASVGPRPAAVAASVSLEQRAS